MLSNPWETLYFFLTQPTASLVMAMLLTTVAVFNGYQGHKMRKLERALAEQRCFFRQELSMISQSAIGVGNRVKYLEQQIKSQPNAFEQVLAKATISHSARPDKRLSDSVKVTTRTSRDVPKVTPAPEMTASRAEHALDRWLRDSRHIA